MTGRRLQVLETAFPVLASDTRVARPLCSQKKPDESLFSRTAMQILALMDPERAGKAEHQRLEHVRPRMEAEVDDKPCIEASQGDRQQNAPRIEQPK